MSRARSYPGPRLLALIMGLATGVLWLGISVAETAPYFLYVRPPSRVGGVLLAVAIPAFATLWGWWRADDAASGIRTARVWGFSVVALTLVIVPSAVLMALVNAISMLSWTVWFAGPVWGIALAAAFASGDGLAGHDSNARMARWIQCGLLATLGCAVWQAALLVLSVPGNFLRNTVGCPPGLYCAGGTLAVLVEVAYAGFLVPVELVTALAAGALGGLLRRSATTRPPVTAAR